MRGMIVGLLLTLVGGCASVAVKNGTDDSFSPVIVSCFGAHVKISVEPREKDGGTIKIECPGNAAAEAKLSVASAQLYVVRKTNKEEFVSRLLATTHGSSIGRIYADKFKINFNEDVNNIGFIRVGMHFETGDKKEDTEVILKNRLLNKKSPVFFYDRQVPRF